jgi:hypothetical protein
VPLDFLKRRNSDQAQTPVAESPLEEAEAHDYGVKLSYSAKSSDGVRMREHPDPGRELPEMVAGLAATPIELVQPVPIEHGNAAPAIHRVEDAAAWLAAHRQLSPIARHGLVVFETVDAIDLAFDTLVLALLHGEVDTSGYPDYSAIVGGVASHWDEETGDLIVRGLVGWGGRGVRGDTDRVASKLLAQLVRNALSSQHAVGMTPIDRPAAAPAGRGGLICPHCGFASAHGRAFYCPKCGMRMLRG